MANPKRIKKKKINVAFDEGIVTVFASYNNTIVNLTDNAGNCIAWSSGGKVGYKGSKKSTPYAAQLASTEIAKIALDAGVSKVKVKVKGPGTAREAAIKALNAAGLMVTMIQDVTPIPHNGCRPPKQRRV